MTRRLCTLHPANATVDVVYLLFVLCVQVDLAYAPSPVPMSGTAFAGGSAVSTFSVTPCDLTSNPAAADAPIQVCPLAPTQPLPMLPYSLPSFCGRV